MIDASALLAILFDEPAAEWVLERLESASTPLIMSTVNLVEVLIKVEHADPDRLDTAWALLSATEIRFVPPDVQQAATAAAARLRHPMNLGDCFVYALAAAEGHPIVTLDSDFRCLGDLAVLPS